LKAYIIRRVLFLFVVLFGVSLLIFGILSTFSPERRAAAFVTSPQQAENIPKLIKTYGFEDPVHVQYVRWLKEMAAGNMGWSLVAARPVLDAFRIYFPITLELNLFTTPLFIVFGIWLGTHAGIRHNKLFDHISRIAAIIGWSLPTFLFALILLMLFYGYFNVLAPGVLGEDTAAFIRNNPDQFIRYTGMYTIDGLLNNHVEITVDALKHLILPVMTQVIVVVALLMRVMRSSMIEEISKDYIITAKAKGADKKTIYIRHARNNALIPVVTVAGQLAAFSMEGSIAVEIIFNRNGLGWWLAESATQLDIPVLMFMCLFMGIIFVTTNLIIDLLYAYIDPRIRLS